MARVPRVREDDMTVSGLIKKMMPTVTTAVHTYGTAVLTRDDEPSAEVGLQLGQAILQDFYWRATTVPQIEGAVTDLVERPKDRDAVSALRLQLRKALEADQELAERVTEMVRTGKPPAVDESDDDGIVDGDDAEADVRDVPGGE
jgi:hypothetical protein